MFRPSGGLKYHLRAWRSDWAETRAALTAWLSGWNAGEELLIFGASGGYMLDSAWLKRFKKIEAFDLDPLAPMAFRLRHEKISFRRKDLFFKNARLSLEPLKDVLMHYPNASLLFSNILGQIPLEQSVQESEWLKFLNELRTLLNGRRWASIHDLWTLEPLAKERHAQVFAAAQQSLQKTAEYLEAKTEVIDHLTGEWVKDLNPKLFAWSLTKESLHILAGVHS